MTTVPNATEVKDVHSSNSYLSYEYIMLLSSLYSKGLSLEHTPDEKKLWAENVDSALEDIGEIYELWQMVVDQRDYGMPIIEDAVLAKAIERGWKRLKTVSKVIDDWSLLRRLPRMFARAELLWGKIIEGLGKQDPTEMELFAKLSGHSAKRSKNLELLTKTYQDNYAKINSTYVELCP